MQTVANVTGVAHVIQLAVAPVFLLTSVGALLSVMTNRLGRVIDRFRALDKASDVTSGDARSTISQEMLRLMRRAKMIHWAIGLCTSCALLICFVIASLFVGALIDVDMPVLIGSLFVLAMLTLVAGLLCFLREITLARLSLHVIPRSA